MFRYGAALFIIMGSFFHCRSYNIKNADSTNTVSNSSSQSPIRECGLEGFTLAIDEHIIDQIEQPIIVRRIGGKITNDQSGWPKKLTILLEIRDARKDVKVHKVYADENGNFIMKNIPEGRYCFKATVMGWQSLMGIIIVDKKADPKSEIVIKMQLGV